MGPVQSRRALSFVASGVPIGQAALSTGAHGKSYYRNGKTLRPWRKAVAEAAREQIAELPAALGAAVYPLAKDVAIELDVTFWLPRPKSVSESKRPLPTVPPDTQHLVRAVEDALTGIVWADDSQITDTTSRKRYAASDATPCASFTIRALGAA